LYTNHGIERALIPIMKSLLFAGILSLGVAASVSAQQPPSKEEIPAEYKPPKGMCRIWLKDVPPNQQPAPTDCAAAVKNMPPNGRVIFGDADDDKREKPKAEPPKGAKGYTGKGGPPPVVIKKPPLRR
jgi:hypothetical protein